VSLAESFKCSGSSRDLAGDLEPHYRHIEMKLNKKLIEVALPLEAVNVASAREKSIRHGHPSTLHLWWARRPLAAARAVIFSQMVDDPSSYVDILLSDSKLRRRAESVLRARRRVWEEANVTLEKAERAGISAPAPGAEPNLEEIAAELERERLFAIIRDLVRWENTTNETVLQAARDEIWQSWRRTCAENADHPRAKELFDRKVLPAFHDPFAGGGALPLEAQRLGLESYASDLNPVAVLINKAMIEIPPKFRGRRPVNAAAQADQELFSRSWHGGQGIAKDVEYYGHLIRDEAEKKIGGLYPRIAISSALIEERPDLRAFRGRDLPVIAWLWARTVPCPNPGCARSTPLLTTFVLSSKPSRQWFIVPEIRGEHVQFRVRPQTPAREPSKGYKRGESGIFECAFCGTITTRNYVADYACSRGLDAVQTAVVVEGDRGRLYLPPESSPLPAGIPAASKSQLDVPFALNPRETWCRNFGLLSPAELFTPRQLLALTTISDLVETAHARVLEDARTCGFPSDDRPLNQGGSGAVAYADAIATYLVCAFEKTADYNSSVCSWIAGGETMRNTFGRQAIPMVWDYAEANLLAHATGSFVSSLDQVQRVVRDLPAIGIGQAKQADAQTQNISENKVVSTDPPYYDNIGYADLSDFFYVWLRRSLKSVYPDLLATMAVPKDEELVAFGYRHESKRKAELFFLGGMTEAMSRLASAAHPAFPVSIYYAVKQSEATDSDGRVSTGWDTFLGAVIRAGFSITGTWPMRTEMSNRIIGSGINSLASSIVLTCRQRSAQAPVTTRREFASTLKAELPQALAHLQRGNIAPVDLAQAAIGPGMAVYTRFSKVLDAEGKPVSVRDALALINQTLDEALAEQEGDFDADTRWALAWFEQHGFAEGEYGVAETLSKAKNTSVRGLESAGILTTNPGKVRLLKPAELPDNWDPATDTRLTNWETVHHLIRLLESGGEGAAAELAAKLGARTETARELAYRLYTVSEGRKRASEALSYNALVQSFPEIARLARDGTSPRVAQPDMFAEPGA
jgi:putative DNA methylase